MIAGKVANRGQGMAVAILYVAHAGRFLSAWWETEPPERTVKDPYPMFRPPDIYSDRVTGTLDLCLDNFVNAGIIRQRFQWIVVSSVWAELGVRRVEKARAKRQGPKPSPEMGGLFQPEDVKSCAR